MLLLLSVLLLLAPIGAVRAQPTITAVSPTANVRNAARTSPVVITFSQTLTTGSEAALKVYSLQRSGLRTLSPAAVRSGSTITFTPAALRPFMPGETVFSTITRTAASSSGALATARVVQFTAAVGGTGQGNFAPQATTPEAAVGATPNCVAMGDIDGDGDLDLLTANNNASGTVSVRLNNGAGVFTAPTNTPEVAVGTKPSSVAMGDVDGDGDLDFVTANSTASTVSVRLNNGAGVFTPQPTTPELATDNIPYSVVLADMDADGDLDLVTANFNASGTVMVSFNNGAGVFSGSTSIYMGAKHYSVAVGDVDADGDLDFVTTNYTNNTVSVRLNNGAGAFSSPASTPEVAVGMSPTSVVLGDIDGDGDLDFVTTNTYGNAVSVRLNNGTGVFTPQPTTPEVSVDSYPYSVALGDIDADGDLDMVTANTTATNTMSIRLNNGAGVFASPVTIPQVAVGSYPQSVVLGDLDGDGDLDALTANLNSNSVSVRLNQPSPPNLLSFAPASGAAGSSVVVTGTGLTGVTALLVNGVAVTPTASSATTCTFVVPAGASSTAGITATTVNGTSTVSTAFTVLLKVASTNPLANARTAPLANSALALTFSEPVSAASLTAASSPVKVFSAQNGGRKAGTWTGGGTATASYTSSLTGVRAAFLPGELVSMSVTNAVLSAGGLAAVPRVYQFTAVVGSNGIGIFTAQPTTPEPAVGATPTSVALGDVDGDGDLDMVTANNNASGTVSVRLNNGTGVFTIPATTPEVAVGNAPRSVTLADVDADGDLDMLTANYGSNTVSVRLNNGAGVFTAPTTTPEIAVGSAPVSVTLGDVDADGDLDLLTANLNAAGTVSVRLNNGVGVFTAPAATPEVAVGNNPGSVTLADVDADGDLDLLTANTNTAGTVSVRLNNGVGVFTAPATTPEVAVGNNPTSVTLGDVDADGDLDLLTANRNATGTVSVRLNNGTGVFTAPAATPEIAVGTTPTSVTLGDVDADGDLDLLTTNSAASGTVSLRLNNGAGVYSAPTTSPQIAVGSNPTSVALGDLDADGDLDFVTTNANPTGTASVRLNQTLPPTITGVVPASGTAGTSVIVTGTNLTGATTVLINGVSVTPTAVSATSLTFGVPIGTGTTQSITITAPNGTSPASTAFAVLFKMTGTIPVVNARTAPLANSALALTFSEPITAASLTTTASAVKVFSAQNGGRKAGTWTGGGTASVSYTSSLTGVRANFLPGELLSVTVPATVLSTGGLAVPKKVFQFNALTGGTGPGTFIPQPTTPEPAVGNSPYNVALGDVDGDGDLDMLTANNNSAGTVSVRFNNGAGVFTAPTNTPEVAVGKYPSYVTLGDVDGDGDLDFVTSNSYNSNTVSVRLNNGAGVFTAPASTPEVTVGTNPYSVVLGDVDGDGDLDMLSANYNSGTVSVRLNNGVGVFTAPANTPEVTVGSLTHSVALGDVDGDGDLDLVTASNGDNYYGNNTVSVRLNNGAGVFTPQPTTPEVTLGNNPYTVALGDVDADGDLDLVAALFGDYKVMVLLNNGAGVFTLQASTPDVAVGNYPYSVVLGDVDADGDLDMLIANGSSVSVRLNNGTGVFTAQAIIPEVAVGSNVTNLALGDVDGDGDLDVLASSASNATVSVRLNQLLPPTVTSFTPASGTAGTSVVAAGYNLTGATTLLVNGVSVTPTAVSATGFTFVVPTGANNTQTITFTAAIGTGVVKAAFSVLLKVTSTSPVANTLAAPQTNSALTLTFTEPVAAASLTIPATAVKVFSAQVGGRKAGTWTGGGTTTASFTSSLAGSGASFMPGELVSVSVPPSVLGAGGLAAVHKVYQFNAATGGSGKGNFVSSSSSPDISVGGGYSYGVVMGDVNGDGTLDVLSINSNSPGAVSVRLNNGAGVFTAPTANAEAAVGNSPISIALGDVDGDGDLDLVTANYSSNNTTPGTVSVRLNNGAGVFTAPATTPEVAVGSNPQKVVLGDVDGDGDLDMLTTNNTFYGGTMSVRLNNGTGVFSAPATSPEVSLTSYPSNIALGDVDADGDLDVVVVDRINNTVSVRLNNSLGVFTPPATTPEVAVGNSPSSVALGDVDGDGDLDMVTSNANASGTVSVRLNNGAGVFTAPTNTPEVAVGSYTNSVTLGDVDADGDLDLITANSNSSGTVSLRLNNGAGVFTALATISEANVGSYPQSIALGDVDGDGDLDLLTSNTGSGTVSVRFNKPMPPTLTSFTPLSGVAGTSITCTGTYLKWNATTLLVNGVTVVPTVYSSNSCTFLVPAGASPTQSISVTTTNGTSAAITTFTVLLKVAATSPGANALAAPRAGSAVALSFSEPVTATSSNIQVFSAQVGGRKGGSWTGSGTATTSYSSYLNGSRANFMPGELVSVSVLPSVLGMGGLAAAKKVFQFATAVSGTGTGTIIPQPTTPEPAVGASPKSVALGDVDGDGDLDMLTANANSSGTVSVRLNNGAGVFTVPTTTPEVAVGANPGSVTLGDVDADGDLDLLTANANSSGTVSVRLNNGAGVFTAPTNTPEVAVGSSPGSVTLGDVDGDGDLDLLTANAGGTISVRLNNGVGVFSYPGTSFEVNMGRAVRSVALGDLDADGDLDLVTTLNTSNVVNVYLNDGAGNFTPQPTTSQVSVGSYPYSVALGDVDADGDLDLLTANYLASGTVSVRLNNGAGVFTAPSNTPEVAVGSYPISVALGDVDADGDLDFFTANSSSATVSVRLNNASGVFTPQGNNPEAPVGTTPSGVALGDLDADGDLDFVTANANPTGTASVRLNMPSLPALMSFVPASGVAGTSVVATGTNLTGATTAIINGVAVPLTGVSTSGCAFVVPAGANNTQNITVSTATGTSPVNSSFAVLLNVIRTSPLANALTAPLAGSALALTFTEPVAATYLNNPASAVKVFSAQVGGRKAGTWTGGTVAAYTSSLTGTRAAFMPGEVLNVTVPATGLGAGGLAATKKVYQFTTAVGGTGGGRFVPQTTTPEPAVGANPFGVALGDVDGDGDLDMLTANANASGTVSVRLNNGAGVYTAPAATPEVAVGNNPNSVVLADVDGDGDLDLLTANNNSSGTVSVRLNNGAGVFTAPASTPEVAVGNNPGCVMLADVDGDGDLDMLTANTNASGTVSVRLNNGVGVFTATATAPDVAVGNNPRSVVLGDVDGDGDLDMLTANYNASGTISVRLNTGTGGFTTSYNYASEIAVGSYPVSIALGDVDGDGNLDALTANYSSGTVSIRLSNGYGNFTAPYSNAEVTVGTNPISVALGDLDADGDLDLVTANYGSGTVSMRLNNGARVFAAPSNIAQVVVGSYPHGVALGDVDADGDLDLVTANANPAGTSSVRLNLTAPPTLTSFVPASGVAGTSIVATGTGLTGATVMLINGVSVTPTGVSATGCTFVVPAGASNTQNVTVTATLGTSGANAAFTVLLKVTGTSPLANASAVPLNPGLALTFSEPVVAASLNTTPTTSAVKVFSALVGGRKTGTWTGGGTTSLNYGSSFIGSRATFLPGELVSMSLPPSVLGIGGLGAYPTVYQFTALSGTGAAVFTPQPSTPEPAVGNSPSNVALADVDNDGDLDMLTANANSNTVSVRLNNGAGVFTAPATFSEVAVGSSPRSIAMGDVDSDGDLDMLTANNYSSTVSVRLNNGAGVFTAPATLPEIAVGYYPYSVVLGDVDGDGDLDMLTANSSSSTVSVRLNNGAGVFTAPTTIPEVAVGSRPVNVTLGDVDGDGDLDLLTANNAFSGTVSVRLNNGTGGFTAPATLPEVAVGYYPYNVALGDVDGDGDLDFITPSYYGNSVGVRLNNGAGVFTALAANNNINVGSYPYNVTLGDVDGDGDLDLLAVNNNSSGTVSVRLNNGAGIYTAPAVTPEVAVGAYPNYLAIGDVNADGTLDFVTANNNSSGTVSVRLNRPSLPTLTSFTPTSGVAGTSIVATGTSLAGTTSLLINGVAVTPTAVTFSGCTFVVPAGASNTQSITATTAIGTSPANTSFAVLLQVASTSPGANANAAPLANSALALTFSEPVTAASAVAGLTVFSAQLGGKKAGSVTLSGNTASFAALASTPSTNFAPGEVISVNVLSSVQTAAGLAASKKVYQFRAAAGTGPGTFAPGSDPVVGTNPQAVVMGDLNGDGFADLVSTAGNSVSLALNTGTAGTFGPATTVGVGQTPVGLALGDMDGDGDLDVVVANANSSFVSVLLNSGINSGIFVAAPNVTGISSPRVVALADIDADGDLDLLVGGMNVLAVRFNDGSGNFTTNADLPLTTTVYDLAVGDVDGDGDLDLATAHGDVSQVRVYLNSGAGAFTQSLSLPAACYSGVALADTDGDGDLDLLYTSNNAGIYLAVNNGLNSGTFPSSTYINTGGSPYGLAMGDVDGDGDLDLLTLSGNAAKVCLNTLGTFGTATSVPVGNGPNALALSDVDGNGNLDLVTANAGSTTVSVRLNRIPPPSLTGVSVSAELPGMPVTLTGTGFTSGSTVSFGAAAAASVTFTSATSLTATIPVSAVVGSCLVVVTTAGQVSTSSPAFSVLEVYNGAAVNTCAPALPATASLNDGAWHYLLSTAGQVVLAYSYTGTSLGTLSSDVLRADPTAPVRQDGYARYYLDRNFHLTASAGPFPGRSVSLRFYGLAAELARLQAADPVVTLANLKATQYSGANEDCLLSNNLSSGQFRVLDAPASAPTGATWFMAQTTVADHFSEFYFTRSTTPLPVELSAFTATLVDNDAVRLAWATASEKNSARFEVERSADGTAFDRLGTVPAAGSSSAARAYDWLDGKLPAAVPILYYRLRLVDVDGTASYSPVRSVTLNGKVGLTLFPNPAHTAATLTGTAPGTLVHMFDALGRVVTTATADANGTAALRLPTGLATGVYIVRAGTATRRLVVE